MSGAARAASVVRESADQVRVRLHGRWAEDDVVRDVFAAYAARGGYGWRNIELTLDDDYDALVIFEHPRLTDYDPACTILFQSGPAPSRARHREFLAHPPGAFRAFYDIERHHSLNIWHVARGQVEATPEKTRLLSAVVSVTRSLPRHDQRLSFVTQHLSTLPGFDHFGRGALAGQAYRGPIDTKADGLLPYRYTFNAENWIEPNYFTEKILDAILCETLCFYDGCPNLELFLDPETYIRIDMARPKEALATIREAIARDEWSRRIEAIRAQKRRLLDDLHPLEIVRKVVSGEPVVLRPAPREAPAPYSLPFDVIEASTRDAQRAALQRIAEGGATVGVVLESRARLTQAAHAVIAAVGCGARPGDLISLGCLGATPFRHRAASLAAGHELRQVAATGDEKICAYAVTPDAARALLRSPDLRPRGVTLLAVWPPIAYAPGPLMRRDGDPLDVSLLGAPVPSRLHGLAGAIVPALPRGQSFMIGATEALSSGAARARRARLWAIGRWNGSRRRKALSASSSYAPRR